MAITEAGGSLCRISDFQKNKSVPSSSQPAGGRLRKMEDRCPWCGQTGHGALVTEDERKQKCKAYGKTCRTCGKPNHLDSVCRSKKRSASTSSASTSTTNTLGIGPFCCISTSRGPVTLLSHHVHNEFSGWAASRPEEHPTMAVSCSLVTPSPTPSSPSTLPK